MSQQIQHTALSIDTVIHRILEEVYPKIFDGLSQLASRIRSCALLCNDEVFSSFVTWLTNAIDDLYRKEKLLLFPRLTIHFNPKEKESAIKPSFNWVYSGHKDIINHLAKMKEYVLHQTVIKCDNYDKCDVYEVLQNVEEAAQYLQLLVEEKLLLPFESQSKI